VQSAKHEAQKFKAPNTFSLTSVLIVAKKNRLTLTFMYLMIRGNTGKEVIQKFMSSNHSEVAAA
jgi:hypothetical protein